MSDSKIPGAVTKRTLVEEGTHFKGALSSNCPVDVKGRVEGDLAAPSLSVSTTGSVQGKVKVGEMRSEGEIADDFDADVVQLSGTVKDNTVIRAKSLEVKLSAANGKLQVVFGECELSIGEDQVAKPVDEPKKAEKKEEKPEKKEEKAASVPPPAETNGAS
jgi:cytoskeletal protein CcmA (bactofilin family)